MYTNRHTLFAAIVLCSTHVCRPLNMNPVPDDVNFVDYHYVGTHNSHVYKRFFTTTYQHETDLDDQLNNGIRGFMLDVYPWNEDEMNLPGLLKTNRRVGPGAAVMSHAKPGVVAFSQKGFTGWDGILAIVEYQTYQYELEKIINFLKKNPREIIVVHMEDYVGIKGLSAETEEAVKRLKYDPLFRPSDWNIKQATPDLWPNLAWMRRNNKRLLITTGADVAPDKITNYGAIWDYRNFQSNTWGSLNTCSDPKPAACNPEELCRTYQAFPNTTVSYFNHFRGDAITWALWDVERDNRYDVLLDAYNKCKNGFFGGKTPNGIFTDRTVESVRDLKSKGIKTVFDLINEWNAQAAAAAQAKREAQEAALARMKEARSQK